MKRIASTAVVAVVLLGAAIYYASLRKPEPDPDPPKPSSTTPAPAPSPSQPKTHQKVPGTLTLEASSSHGYLPKDEDERLYASIDVTAEEFQGAERPPLNVALVIDRSGSMRGKKMRYVKRAANTIIDMLEDGDRLSIVSYQSRARIDLRAEKISVSSKDRMRRAIRQLRAAGGTNIGAAITSARQVLTSAKSDESVNRAILLSDGKPTVGVSASSRLSGMAQNSKKNAVSITTMGVGVDYNEDLMTKMANVGGGNYYFINAPKKVVSMFEEELGGLAQTVAKNASLVIDLGKRVELEEVHGYPSRNSGRRIYVSLSEFFAEQNKSVLLELHGKLNKSEPEPVVEVELSYEDLVEDKPRHQEARLTSAATDDSSKIEAELNRDVISRVQQVEVASSIDEAMEAFEDGDKDRAQKLLDERKRRVRQAQKKFALPQKSIDGVEQELAGTKKDVREHSSSSGAGKAVIKRSKAKSNIMMLDSKSMD